MSRVTIDLPDPVMEFIDEQIRLGSAQDAGQYISELIRVERERRALAEVELRLLQSEASGFGDPWTAQSAEELKAGVRARRGLRTGP